MDVAARASQIRQPASTGGAPLTSGSPPGAAAAGNASMLRHHDQTSDACTLAHLTPPSLGDATSILQTSSGTTSRPGTSRDDSCREHSAGPGRKSIRLSSVALDMEETSPDIPDATPSNLDQGSLNGRGDSLQQSATDQQPRIIFSLDRVQRILNHIRYLEPAPWNLPSWCTDPPRQEFYTSFESRSLESSVSHSQHHHAGRHTESGAGRLNEFPRTVGASHDRLASSRTEGTLFSGNRIIQGSTLRHNSVRHASDVRRDATASARPFATSSCCPSAAPGGPRLATVGYLHNRHAPGSSLLHSQHSTTADGTSSFASFGNQPGTQQDALWSHSELSSRGERLPEMRRNRGPFGGSPQVASQRAALSPYLPSTSSYDSHFTALGHPTGEVHERRHFDTPPPAATLPTPPVILPRPPYIRTLPRGPFHPLRSAPIPPCPSPRNTRPMTQQERGQFLWARSLLLPPQPPMPSFEPPEDEDEFLFDGLDDEMFGIGPRGLSECEIDCLLSYPFKPEAHQPEQMSCAVCMSQVESEELVRGLPCNHQFHATCVDRWLRKNRTCPLCRRDASVAGPSAPDTV